MPKVRKTARLSPKTVSNYSANPSQIGSSPRLAPRASGGNHVELTTVDSRVLEEARRLAKPFPEARIKVLNRTTVLVENH